jgi:hypothetical protein
MAPNAGPGERAESRAAIGLERDKRLATLAVTTTWRDGRPSQHGDK